MLGFFKTGQMRVRVDKNVNLHDGMEVAKSMEKF